MSLETARASLARLGYEVACFATKEEAAAYLDQAIDGRTVGIGGSLTVEELGLYDRLAAHNEVSWHWRVPENSSAGEVLAKAATAEVYIASANGLAATGEIINIDNNCNRVSSILYGHEKVWLLIGRNKIAPDFTQALYRARNIAAPLNAKRLKRRTPCAIKADKCYDCQSPDRICRALSVLWAKPAGCDYGIVLIDEDLGY